MPAAGVIARSLRSMASMVDGSAQQNRLSRYGEAYVTPLVPDYYGYADEGSYFVAAYPQTPGGSGLTGTASQSSFSDTAPIVVIKNSDTAPTATVGHRVYLDYIKLTVTTAPNAATNFIAAMIIDSAAGRYASGGTVIPISCVNMDEASSPVSLVYAGVPTAAARSANARIISPGQYLRAALPVVGDTYLLNFGGVDKPLAGPVGNGTNPQFLMLSFAPVVLGPGHTFTLHTWGASAGTTAPVVSLEVGLIER